MRKWLNIRPILSLEKEGMDMVYKDEDNEINKERIVHKFLTPNFALTLCQKDKVFLDIRLVREFLFWLCVSLRAWVFKHDTWQELTIEGSVI